MATPVRQHSLSTISDSLRSTLRSKILGPTAQPTSDVAEVVGSAFPNLVVDIQSIELLNNRLSQVVVISRKVKFYNESTGPLESIQVVVDSELCYTVYIFCEVYLKGQLSSSDSIKELNCLKMMNDSTWTICTGINNYSSYNLHHSVKHVVHMTLPIDSVRHDLCSRIFKSNKQKSSMCSLCSPLKYYLSRKRKIEANSPTKRVNCKKE